jgi:hypothetical protein
MMSVTMWLRAALVLVLGGGAILLLAHGPHTPPLIALGGSEVVGAVLFAIPRTRWIGGCVLLAVLAAAALFHALSGEVPPPAFLVYGTAIVATMRRATS